MDLAEVPIRMIDRRIRRKEMVHIMQGIPYIFSLEVVKLRVACLYSNNMMQFTFFQHSLANIAK